MPEVQPTNNPVPSDHPADARDNFKRIDEVVNLQSNQSSPARTGKRLETLFGLEQKYLQAIQQAGGVPLNGGVWAAGQTFTSYNQFMIFNNVPYRPLTTATLPYGPTGASPDPAFVGPYESLSVQSASELFINPNLIPNPSFDTSGSVVNPPDSTPRSYSANDELFAGHFAVSALTAVTYVDGLINGTGQLYTDVVKSQKQIDSTATLSASIAGADGLSKSGASVVDNGTSWRVTYNMSDTFSVKLEQGSVSTGHEVKSLFDIYGHPDMGIYRAEAFGAKDGEDSTKAFQSAQDAAEENGGGDVTFGKGTFYLSIAKSYHPYVCLMLGQGVTLEGSSWDESKLIRLPSERAVDGVLICNKGYDLAENGGNYSAAGNIKIRQLFISDGDAAPNRGLGDLIGFGNGDGLIVEQCRFGNHDQHAVDVCKSRNFKIRDNISNNKVQENATAVYQIDAGLILGIAGPTQHSYQGQIIRNVIEDTYASAVIHCHSSNWTRDVEIIGNVIRAENIPDGGYAIGSDSDCYWDGVKIERNSIHLDNINSRGIYCPEAQGQDRIIRDLSIYNNRVEGTFAHGIWVGQGTPTPETTYERRYNVSIKNNYIKNDLTGQSPTSLLVKCIFTAFLEDVDVNDNTIDITIGDYTGNVDLIEDQDCLSYSAYDNTIRQRGSASGVGTYYAISSSLQFNYDNGFEKEINIKNNKINADNCTYHIIVNSYTESAGLEFTNYSGVIGGNTMEGSVKTANISTPFPISDGTNNERWIDLQSMGATPEAPFFAPITQGTKYQDIPLPASITSTSSNNQSQASVSIFYSPLSANGFVSDVEDIKFAYLSSNQVAGTQVVNIDTRESNKKFDILTGNAGVSCVINDTSFEPVIRTSGFIKIKAGV